MYLQRPGEAAGRGRFWLALSLSTVTAAAVAAPLALTAVNYDSERVPLAPAESTTLPEDSPGSPTALDMPIIVDESSDGLGNIGPASSETSTTVGSIVTEQRPRTTTVQRATTTASTTTTTEPTTSTTEPTSTTESTLSTTTSTSTTDPTSTTGSTTTSTSTTEPTTTSESAPTGT